MKIKLITAFILLIIPFNTSFGFDGSRKGFVLGLGFGLNGNEIVIKKSGAANIENTNGFSGTLRAGYGVDNKLVLYVERKDGFYYINDNGDDVLWSSSFTGIGIDYFFYDLPSSPYFSVSYGYGDLKTVSEKGYDDYHGDSYRVGIGYQSETHLGIELSGTRKELRKGSTTVTVETILLSFMVLLF